MRSIILFVLLTLSIVPANGIEPVSASMRISGRFAKGYSFALSLSSEGESRLTVERPGTPAREAVQVPPAKLNELRDLLRQERFFELAPSYGDVVPDGSTTTITARLGTQTKRVKLHYLRRDDPRLPEIRRTVRVASFLRGLFEHPDAVDLRPYAKRFLEDSSK